MSQNTTQVQTLPLDFLQPNPLQPRSGMDEADLQELADSIKQQGILEPLVVAHTPAGYQIIAGERRWKAAKLAGLTEAPCIIKETSPKGMLEMAIIENVQRVDLPPMDRANAFKRLIDDFRLTVGQIAMRVGKSQAYVSNTLRLLALPDALKDGLLSGLITEGHARALSSIEDPRLMIEAYKIVLKESGSVRRAEELARRMKAKSGQSQLKGYQVAPYVLSQDIQDWQQDLQQYFGPRSQVKILQSRSQTKVQFVFKGTPNEVAQYVNRIRELSASPLPEPVPEDPIVALSSFATTEIVIGD